MKTLPKIIWRVPDEHVYLTFDDGPDAKMTPALLTLLHKHTVRATFFLLGEKVRRHPEVVRQICEAGHAIGNHSFSHPNLIGKSKEVIRDEVLQTDAAIVDVVGKTPALFRPPYGRFGVELMGVLSETHHRLVLWSGSTKDYRTESDAEMISGALIRLAKPGKVILLHDGHLNSGNTLQALERTLGKLAERGLTFSSIPEN